MRYAIAILLFEGALFGQQYEIGATLGYGFYRNGTIFSDSGTVQAGSLFNAEARRAQRKRRVVCHDGRGGRVRETREDEFDAETRRRGGAETGAEKTWEGRAL
jgi:hypothetical protein